MYLSPLAVAVTSGCMALPVAIIVTVVLHRRRSRERLAAVRQPAAITAGPHDIAATPTVYAASTWHGEAAPVSPIRRPTGRHRATNHRRSATRTTA